MTPVGLTKDAGWEIGVSRTVPAPLEEVWRQITSAGAAIWLGSGVSFPAAAGDPYETGEGTVGEFRSFRPLDRMRLTWKPAGWSHDTTVQLVLRPAATGTSIRFHQERLADGDERERQRAHWAAVLDRLAAALGDDDKTGGRG